MWDTLVGLHKQIIIALQAQTDVINNLRLRVLVCRIHLGVEDLVVRFPESVPDFNSLLATFLRIIASFTHDIEHFVWRTSALDSSFLGLLLVDL